MNTGKISESILKRSVLRKIKTRREEVRKGAGVGEDCAFLSWKKASPEELEDPVTAISTQTMTLPVKREAWLAVMAACNNLAAQGAAPTAVMLSLTLPVEAEERQLQELMEQAQECCDAWNIQIAGGHTEVSRAVRWPVITATAMGTPAEETSVFGKRAENPGREAVDAAYRSLASGKRENRDQRFDVVISKWIGLEGTAIIVREKEEELLGRFSPGFLAITREQERYLSLAPEAAIALKSNVYAMHDMRNGGVFGALWELSRKLGVGLTIDLKKIPVRQETIEICEFYNLSPYELLSGGALIMVTENGFDLVRQLEEAGIPAALIGTTNDSNDRLVLNGEDVRYLGPPGPDEIYKLTFTV